MAPQIRPDAGPMPENLSTFILDSLILSKEVYKKHTSDFTVHDRSCWCKSINEGTNSVEDDRNMKQQQKRARRNTSKLNVTATPKQHFYA